MNIFSWLFKTLVYDPQVNLLQLLFNLTQDTGASIVLLAIIVNLALWPVFASSYINTQKIRLLQPKLKELQQKYKNDPQESLKQTVAFNKKHKLSGSSVFFGLLIQLFIATGVYFVTIDITAGKSISDNLYPFIKNLPLQNLSTKAFDLIPLQSSASEQLWYLIFPILSALFIYLNGMYIYRWSPQIKINADQKEIKQQQNTTKEKNEQKDEKILDPEALQKSMEFNTIYVLPVVYFFFNVTLPMGVNIYFVTSGLMSLLRQLFLTNFYAGHTEKLMEDIAKSDPQSVDEDPSNNVEITANPFDLAEQPVPVEVIQNKNTFKIKNKVNKAKITKFKKKK